MNFKQRENILRLLYEERREVFFSEDTDEHTEVLEEIDRTIDAVKEMTEHTLDEPPTSLMENEDYADVFTVEKWMSEGMRGCCFIPSDGSGYWGTEKEHSMDHSDVWGHKPKWATHVIWFNK